MNPGFANYSSTMPAPTNAASEPALDDWGPDWPGYWSLADWIAWHQANVAANGAAVANQKFAAAWNQQGWGAGPVNELEFNSNARQYFASNGLANLIDPTLGGMMTDLGSAGTNITTSLASSSNTFRWAVPVAGLVLLYFAVQSIGKDPGGQSKKFLGGVGELY